MPQPMPILPKAASAPVAPAAINILPKETPAKTKQETMNNEAYFTLLSALAAKPAHGVGSLDLVSLLGNIGSCQAHNTSENMKDLSSLNDFMNFDSSGISSPLTSGSSPIQSYLPSQGVLTTPSLTPPSALLNSVSGSPLFDTSASHDISSSYALSALFPDIIPCQSPTESSATNNITSSTASASCSQLTSKSASQSTIDVFGSPMLDITHEPTESIYSAPKNHPSSPSTHTLKAEVARKRRDSEFLASLPPQLALKRRRTGNNKHKDKILAELMTTDEPSPKMPTEVAAPTPVEVAKPIKADDSEQTEPSSDKSVDPIALKRQKNTDAARRSRMRKILRIETLETRVTELETENISLTTQVKILESEKSSSQQRESDLAERIRQLEKQIEFLKQHPHPISFQNLFE
ncbi:hypothetical protein H4219_001211 [Mycoemilia scoparia]|uniref:BZIP domain-containing protein n=1 Tax=Mycoemilia scoparia TaxID=417184 RepID=A0A9W8DQP2_9FUNG|nr:hypothetical protein H4219_001211 [Mycoemilia scoparia]